MSSRSSGVGSLTRSMIRFIRSTASMDHLIRPVLPQPFSGAVDDAENDNLLGTFRERNETIRDDVGQSGNNLLVGPSHPARPPGRHFPEQTAGAVYSFCYSRGRAWVTNSNVGY